MEPARSRYSVCSMWGPEGGRPYGQARVRVGMGTFARDTVTATVGENPPASIVNTASVTPSGLATCAPSGTPPPCSATAIGTVAAPPTAIATPATDVWMLMLLGLGLLGLTWRVGRRVD